jgi:protein-S-isoprenylcysteine O-methyltransferase Ste14
MQKRLLRWLLVNVWVAAVVLALTGRAVDGWVWAYLLVFALTTLYALGGMSDDLARERFRPPERGADARPLLAIRLIALAHLVVGALDSARWHLTDSVPDSLRAIGLAGMALGFLLVFRAMRENRFFSPVVRIQSDRGHRVVSTGPYALVRHPGYAGMIPAVPMSGLALGSWLSVAIAIAYSILILRRVIFEDAFLRRSLEGYDAYAQTVRHRLVPGIW